ncbi:MAG: aminopeptidase P family protein [Chloroflexi bacterium]|nr:aminopeptidase P family protein [Chloroflexota bacterium]
MARKTLQRTTAPLYPEHPMEEHEWRLARARSKMAEDGLDALILARNVNVFYMTGSRFVFVGMDQPSALTPQSVAIVTRDADIYSQRFGPFDSDEVPLHTALSGQIELYDDETELVSILADYGVGKGARVGTEWGPGLTLGINPLKFLKIKERIEKELGAEVVDGSPTIWKMRSVKSPLEIERMKVAVGAAARAMERVYDTIELGMNELEVSRMASRFMLEEGGDQVTHSQVMAEGEEAVNLLSCDAVDRPIGVGWVHLDIGCKYRRYGSDINRGIFLGRQPTSEERHLYACRQGINELFDRTIKPGVSFDELLSKMKAYAESQGCVVKEIGGNLFAGHNIGLEPYQPPNLIPSAAQPVFQNENGQVIFEPGMMFTYEMAVELPGVKTPFFNIEDNVVVTEDGVENMCGDLSRELRVKA